MPILFRDFEARSSIDIDVGTRRFVSDATTELLCCAFAIDDGPVQEIRREQLKLPPPEFIAACQNPDWLVVAHHDAFETAVEERLGWPVVPLERHRCTAAMARAACLPGSLEGAAEACGLAVGKDKAGSRLMRAIATRKIEPILDELERLYAYCRQDVEVLRALFKALPPLGEVEQAVWALDQEINARGFYVDRGLALAMRDVAVKRRIEIAAELVELTSGAVTSPNQTARIKQWLGQHGHNPGRLDKKAKTKLLSGAPAPQVKRVLELVTEVALKTVDKANALLASIDADERIRSTLVYCGATSGRWTAAGFQPQNISREDESLDTSKAIAAFVERDMAAIKALGPPLEVAPAFVAA